MKVKIGYIKCTDVLNIEDPNRLFFFYKKLNRIFDQACSLILRKSCDFPRKPYAAHNLLKSIKEKKLIYKGKIEYPNKINIANLIKIKKSAYSCFSERPKQNITKRNFLNPIHL